MVGDKLAGNQKEQHRFQRDIAKKKKKKSTHKKIFVLSLSEVIVTGKNPQGCESTRD